MAPASPPKIRVGFVGLSATGWAASSLGPSLNQPLLRGTYDLVAVSTTSQASAQASADKYSKDFGHPIKAYFGDSSKIASDPAVNLVAIAVKAPYHKQVVLPVIEAKKDFFVEWPAGASTQDTEEIAATARNAGVRSMVGLQGRHSAVIRKAKEILLSGIIGTVRSTNIFAHIPRELNHRTPFIQERNLWIAEKKNGASQLHIPIAHVLDTFTYLLGDFINLTATAATFYPVVTVVDSEEKPTGKTITAETPDHFVITGFLKGGVLANLFWRGGYASSEGRRQFIWEIEGEEGSIRIESHAAMGAFPSVVEPDLCLNGKKVEFDIPGSVIESLGIAWKDFADHVHAGDYATIEDAVKHHKLLDAIERSAQLGERVTL